MQPRYIDYMVYLSVWCLQACIIVQSRRSFSWTNCITYEKSRVPQHNTSVIPIKLLKQHTSQKIAIIQEPLEKCQEYTIYYQQYIIRYTYSRLVHIQQDVSSFNSSWNPYDDLRQPRSCLLCCIGIHGKIDLPHLLFLIILSLNN